MNKLQRNKYIKYTGKDIRKGIIDQQVIESKNEQVAEEQGGFRSGNACIDQIFILKQLVWKNRKRSNEMYIAFLDLQKAYVKYVEKNCGGRCMNVKYMGT